MNRHLFAALTAAVFVLAACSGGGAKTKSGFALGEEAFTLPAIPVTVINETRVGQTVYTGYAIVPGAGIETLYRLPATIDGTPVELGTCTPACGPIGFGADPAAQLLLRGSFSGSDNAVRAAVRELDLRTLGALSADAPLAGEMLPSPLIALFATRGDAAEQVYAIEASIDGERTLVRLFADDAAAWGSPISAERYGDGTRCDGGICAVAQSGTSLYIAFGSGEIVAYDTETGKEQEVPASYQLADGFVATSFFWVGSSEILILAEGDAGWLVVRKIPGVWNPSEISTDALLTAPTPALNRGGQTAYVVAQSTGEGDVALSLNTGGGSVEYPVYEVIGDGSTEREKIAVDLSVGLASFGRSSSYHRTVAVDTQGRLFSLAGSAAHLIETQDQVVDLIALGEILFVGQTGTDGLIHYSPLLKVGRSDESAADERKRARALGLARTVAAATAVAGPVSIVDYLLPNGRLNEEEPAVFGRSR